FFLKPEINLCMYNRLQILIVFTVLANIAVAQQIEGTVTDRLGEPVIGATVVVKGSNIVTVSDINGHFSFAPPKELPFSVTISSTGFKAQDVQFFELPDEPLAIALNDDNVLSEVVVTARRRTETLQNVPIPVAVLSGELVEDAGAFNVNRV